MEPGRRGGTGRANRRTRWRPSIASSAGFRCRLPARRSTPCIWRKRALPTRRWRTVAGISSNGGSSFGRVARSRASCGRQPWTYGIPWSTPGHRRWCIGVARPHDHKGLRPNPAPRSTIRSGRSRTPLLFLVVVRFRRVVVLSRLSRLRPFDPLILTPLTFIRLAHFALPAFEPVIASACHAVSRPGTNTAPAAVSRPFDSVGPAARLSLAPPGASRGRPGSRRRICRPGQAPVRTPPSGPL